MLGPRINVQPHAQRMQHFQGCGQGRVPLLAPGLLEPFAGDACVAGKLHHAASASDVAQRFGEQGSIVRRLLNAGLLVHGAVFIGLQEVGGIKRLDAQFFSGCGVHRSFLQELDHALGLGNVPGLSGLVAAAQGDDNHGALFPAIDAVAGPGVDAKLRYFLAYRFAVAPVAERQARQNLLLADLVAKRANLSIEFSSAQDLEHWRIVNHGVQKYNNRPQQSTYPPKITRKAYGQAFAFSYPHSL